MHCNTVRDLIPLYIDNCCSAESRTAVEQHICSCDGCRRLLEGMRAAAVPTAAPASGRPYSLLRCHSASVLQTLLLFFSFALITVGVALEAKTPTGLANGFWACNLVVPTTGFLLSLTNWYFVQLYKSRKRFTVGSLLATLGFTLCGHLWASVHYGFAPAALLSLLTENGGIAAAIELVQALSVLCGIGILLTLLLCVASAVLSARYARLLGKE